MGLSVVYEGAGTGCAVLWDDADLDVGGGVFGGQGDWACDCDGCKQHCGESGELHGDDCWVCPSTALRVCLRGCLSVVLSWVSRLIIEGDEVVLLCDNHCFIASLHCCIVPHCIASLSG